MIRFRFSYTPDTQMRLGFGIAIVIALASTACTHVAPYQRSKLAHATMTLEPTGPAMDHVYSVQEGAVGGGASGESGCGCN